MKTTIEVLCGSVKDCIIAMECKANRIELNNGTLLGGLTPSLGTLIEAKKHVDIPIVTMVRPRSGGFLYDEYEVAQMMLDARLLLEHGSDGIVFGFLDSERNIDKNRTQQFTDLAHQYGKEAIFHRAFDNVRDPYESIEFLIECGVDRILTSGLGDTVEDGMELLQELHEKYGHLIELLPGGGVSPDNIKDLVTKTGIHDIHGSFKEWVTDPTTSRYRDKDKVQEPDYFNVSPQELIKAISNSNS